MKMPASPVARTLLQCLAGAAGGVALGLVIGLVGGQLGRGDGSGWGDLGGAIILGALGYVVGAGLGAHLAGRRLGQPSVWWFALAASAGAAIAVLALAEPAHLNTRPELMQVIFIVAAPLAATFVPRLMPAG